MFGKIRIRRLSQVILDFVNPRAKKFQPFFQLRLDVLCVQHVIFIHMINIEQINDCEQSTDSGWILVRYENRSPTGPDRPPCAFTLEQSLI